MDKSIIPENNTQIFDSSTGIYALLQASIKSIILPITESVSSFNYSISLFSFLKNQNIVPIVLKSQGISPDIYNEFPSYLCHHNPLVVE